MLEIRSVARSIPLSVSKVKTAKRPSLAAMHKVERPLVQLGTQGVFAQAGDGGGVVDDRRGGGRARLRHQLPGWFPVETSKYEG